MKQFEIAVASGMEWAARPSIGEGRRCFVLEDSLGLHARPAAQFVQIARKFQSEINIRRVGESPVNGKSILDVLILGLQCGSEVEVSAKGHDAHEALAAVEHFFKNENRMAAMSERGGRNISAASAAITMN